MIAPVPLFTVGAKATWTMKAMPHPGGEGDSSVGPSVYLSRFAQWAQRMASRQRGYLCLVDTIVDDQEHTLRTLRRRPGKDEGTLRQVA